MGQEKTGSSLKINSLQNREFEPGCIFKIDQNEKSCPFENIKLSGFDEEPVLGVHYSCESSPLK